MNNSNQSPFLLIKQLTPHITGILSQLAVYDLPRSEQKIVLDLKQQLNDARLYIRDYELSETRAEQLENAAEALKRLDTVRSLVLAASEYNVFTAIDVAHITAQLELIQARVR